MWKAGPTERSRRGQGGYTYVTLLVMLVALSMAAQTTWIPSSTTARRAAEQELIFQGRAYRDAIRAYWAADGDAPALPASLEDLLDDPRTPGQRHIRRLYAPAIGGEWEAIPSPSGGIGGVRPDSRDAPLKRANFSPDLGFPDQVDSYRDWTFIFDPDANTD